ncbi:MAG TPA: SRPBCC family protein [Candidatus Acidoferrales bacterium]|nr:SRPBCC family protein [Candidatus Acidoferrales bacterium]
MTRVECTVEIATAPNEIAVFFVPGRMSYWYGREMDAEIRALACGAEFMPSQIVQISGKIRGREVAHSAVITKFEWGKLLEWRFKDSYGVRGIERWEIEPTADSSTRVRMISEYEMPGAFAGAIDWLVTRRALARRNREYLARLKKLAERT